MSKLIQSCVAGLLLVCGVLGPVNARAQRSPVAGVMPLPDFKEEVKTRVREFGFDLGDFFSNGAFYDSQIVKLIDVQRSRYYNECTYLTGSDPFETPRHTSCMVVRGEIQRVLGDHSRYLEGKYASFRCAYGFRSEFTNRKGKNTCPRAGRDKLAELNAFVDGQTVPARQEFARALFSRLVSEGGSGVKSHRDNLRESIPQSVPLNSDIARVVSGLGEAYREQGALRVNERRILDRIFLESAPGGAFIPAALKAVDNYTE